MLWQYDSKGRDWLIDEHESTLTGFMPDHELETLLELNINTGME